MSNYSEDDRIKMQEIKNILKSLENLGVSIVNVQNYVDKGIPMDVPFVQISLDNLVNKCGKVLVSEYIRESIRNREKGEIISYDVKHQTLFKGERTERVVCDDDDRESAWGHYCQFLLNSGFTNIDEIKTSAINILEMMKQDTLPGNPIRGAVIGNVQSGKTANMEALISLAADNGWNFFVILTGLTTNLMEQTRDRMLGDLRRDVNDPHDPLIYNWEKLDPLIKAKDFLQTYDINFNSNTCYICHAQKNIVHLNNVIQCLDRIPQKERIHLLVIDDESDQASVDSNKKDAIRRSTINQKIINLVYNYTHSTTKDAVKTCNHSFGSVNYLGYTATPYANLLNEPTGLYPENFITGLSPSSLYMGLKEYYGDGEDGGLREHATVIDDDIGKIIKRRSEKPIVLPESLKDSIAWFYCCVAILKLRKFGKPVSMLINVDVQVKEHVKMNNAVRQYILEEGDELRKRCKKVYSEQTARLTVEQFKDILPEYGDDVEGLVIRDYPDYSEIESRIESLINNGLTYIAIDENKQYVYSPDTIHDCVDNGSDESIPIEGAGKDYTNRIIYPNKKNNPVILKETPAFLVIGGQTLSRGLTIEGLVSTYFIRKTATADTCLQMARWFGFRNGYELLPRIWMDSITYRAFCALAVINEALFQEIKKYNLDGIDPKDYYAKIRDVPAACMLKSLTSSNKCKASSKTYKNSGFRAKDKYPTKFFNDVNKLQYNVQITEELLANYEGVPSETGSSIIFHDIPFKEIVEYLSKLKRPVEDSTINSFDPFMDWLKHYDPKTITNCNIILYGTEKQSSDLVEPVRTFCGKYRINKVQRSRQADNIEKDIIRFKTVRDKKSLLLDLDLKECEKMLENEPGSYKKLIKGDPTVRCQVRKNLEMGKTATLSITTIGIDNNPANGYVYDIIAPSIFVPGDVESEFDFNKTPYVHMMETGDDSPTHS